MSKRKKPWQRTGRSGRRVVQVRTLREKILIMCEGEATEPNYFKSFPIDQDKIEVTIIGEGDNTDHLVEVAIKRKQEAEKNKTPFNQVWCVFDRDSFPAKRFNRAIQIAINNQINVAYSNEAFEMWYLLHFEYFVAAMSRRQYQDKLSALLSHNYEKNSSSMYQELLDKQTRAIERAEKLLDEYKPSINPEKDNPSTTVHLLVEVLNEFLSDI